MKKILLLCLLVLLSGCNEHSDTEIEMVDKYWKSIQKNDVSALKGLISKSEFNTSYGKDSGFSGFNLKGDVKIGKKLKNGNIETTFSVFCHSEYSIETVIIQNEGEKLIDGRATFLAMLKESRDIKPLKKYCYTFKNKLMSGKINGNDIVFRFLNKKIIDSGVSEKKIFELTTENCMVKNCSQSKSPTLLIRRLKLNTEGGNFTYKENITIYDPLTNHNLGITEGSYKISTNKNGKKKLEISFNLDKNNFLNGYVEY